MYVSVTLAPTAERRQVGGVECRVWVGCTSGGRRVEALVAAVSSPDRHGAAELAGALAEVDRAGSARPGPN